MFQNALPTAALIIGLGMAAATVPPVAASPEIWKIEGWKHTDFSKTSIDFKQVLSGGPPKDGIPSIDNPVFKPLAEAARLADMEPVIGLEINGDARAYPLRILTWHEIVNDVVGGLPVTVTYCPLCNAALVFERTVDNKVFDFGTTGKLRNSDLIMYDRQTESWWQQFTGEAIVGEMLGTRLKIVPSRLESYAEFRKRRPTGKIQVPNNPAMRQYGRNPYVGYDTAARPFLYRGSMPAGIAPMVRVIVVREADKPVAVAMPFLRERKQYEWDGVMLRWRAGQASALDNHLIAKGRDVGNVTAQRKSGDGRLEDVAYDVTFAFVFHAFHPHGRIITRQPTPAASSD